MMFSKLSQNIIKTASSRHRESKSVEGLISLSPSSIAQGKLRRDGNLINPNKHMKINGTYADSKRNSRIIENSSGVNSSDELDGWNYGQLQEQQQQIKPYQQHQSYLKDPPGTFSGLRIVTSNKIHQTNNNKNNINDSHNQITGNSSSVSSSSSLSSSQIGLNNESAIFQRKKPTNHIKLGIEKDKLTNRQKNNNSKDKIISNRNSSKNKNNDNDDGSSKSKLLLLLQPSRQQQQQQQQFQMSTKSKEGQTDKSKERKTDRKFHDKSVDKYSNRSNKTPVLASESLHSSRLCTPEKKNPKQNSSKIGFAKNNNNNNINNSSSYRSRSSSLFIVKNEKQNYNNVPCHPLKQPIFQNSMENKDHGLGTQETSNPYFNITDKKDDYYIQKQPLSSSNQLKLDNNIQNVSPYEVFFQGEMKIQPTQVQQQQSSSLFLKQNHKVSEMRLKRIRQSNNNVLNSRVLNYSENNMVDEKSGMLKDQAKRRILQIIQRQNGQSSENESEKDSRNNHSLKIKNHQPEEKSNENQENIGCEEQENEIKGYIKGLMKVLKKISSAKKTNPKIEGSNSSQQQVSTSKIKMASVLHPSSQRIDQAVQLSLMKNESPSKKQYDPVNYSYPDALNLEIKQLSEKKLSSKKHTPLKNGLAFVMFDKQIGSITNNNSLKVQDLQRQEKVDLENSQNQNRILRLSNENTTSKKYSLNNISPANGSDLKFYATPSSRSASSDKQQKFNLRKHVFDNKNIHRQSDSSVQKQEGMGYYDFDGQGELQMFQQQQNNDKMNQNHPIRMLKRNASIQSRSSRNSSININNPINQNKGMISQPQETHQNNSNIQPIIEKVILDKLNSKHKRSVSAYRVQKVQPTATQRERSVSTKNQHGQGYLRNNPVETVVSKDTILSKDMQNEGFVRIPRGSRSTIKILNPYKSAEKLAQKGQRKMNHNRCTSEPRGINVQRDDQQEQQGLVRRQILFEQQQISRGLVDQGQTEDQQELGKYSRKSSAVGVSNFRERRAQMKSASSASESNQKLKHQYWMDILISSGNTPEKQHNIEGLEEQKEQEIKEVIEGNRLIQENQKKVQEDIRKITPERQIVTIQNNNHQGQNISKISLSPIVYVENHRTSLSNMEATHKSVEVPYENFDRFSTSMFSEDIQLKKEDKQQQQWMRQSQVEKENNEKEALIHELSQIIRQETQDQHKRNDIQVGKVISSQDIVFFNQLKAGGSKAKLFGEESQLSGIAAKKDRLRSRNSFCSSDVALKDYLHVDHKSQIRAPSVGLDVGGESVQKSQLIQESQIPLLREQIPQIKQERQQQRMPGNSMLFLRSGANIVKPPHFQRIFVSPEQKILKQNSQSNVSLESKDDERILDLLLLDTLELKDKLSGNELQQQKQLQNKQF